MFNMLNNLQEELMGKLYSEENMSKFNTEARDDLLIWMDDINEDINKDANGNVIDITKPLKAVESFRL